EAYIHEELLEDDDYSYRDEEGDLGWTQIDEYNLSDYSYKKQFSIVITIPPISFYEFNIEDWNEAA
ncbi:MAG: hypothetical protein QF605_09380, partial [Rhodospirillales bacterium]|nr:hypothetical protein [Rhodospirillales bacterium]